MPAKSLRESLTQTFSAAAIIFGILAGFFRGWVDDVIQYIYTTLNSIPSVLLIAASILMVQVYMGNMINGARLEMARESIVWWLLTAAFVFMLALVLAANLFADTVQDAFDPRRGTQR